MEKELTPRGRLAAMLITAALLLPLLALCGILVMRHFFWVHYPAHVMRLWLLLDVAILCAGLIVRENDGVTASTRLRTKRAPRRLR